MVLAELGVGWPSATGRRRHGGMAVAPEHSAPRRSASSCGPPPVSTRGGRRGCRSGVAAFPDPRAPGHRRARSHNRWRPPRVAEELSGRAVGVPGEHARCSALGRAGFVHPRVEGNRGRGEAGVGACRWCSTLAMGLDRRGRALGGAVGRVTARAPAAASPRRGWRWRAPEACLGAVRPSARRGASGRPTRRAPARAPGGRRGRPGRSWRRLAAARPLRTVAGSRATTPH